MSDRELIKYAGKAAGINGHLVGSGDIIYERGGNSYYWNPLNNGDDTFRLMVRLDINVYTSGDCVFHDGVIVAYNPDDIYSAARRAVVVAAAEIGKKMS